MDGQTDAPFEAVPQKGSTERERSYMSKVKKEERSSDRLSPRPCKGARSLDQRNSVVKDSRGRFNGRCNGSEWKVCCKMEWSLDAQGLR